MSADLTSAVERENAPRLAAERAAHMAEPAASEHAPPAPSNGLASPTAIAVGSVAFGVLFLLAWQFLPPALGVPSYIIPTVTDLWREFGRMVARENLFVHILSTVTIARGNFVCPIASLMR